MLPFSGLLEVFFSLLPAETAFTDDFKQLVVFTAPSFIGESQYEGYLESAGHVEVYRKRQCQLQACSSVKAAKKETLINSIKNRFSTAHL